MDEEVSRIARTGLFLFGATALIAVVLTAREFGRPSEDRYTLARRVFFVSATIYGPSKVPMYLNLLAGEQYTCPTYGLHVLGDSVMVVCFIVVAHMWSNALSHAPSALLSVWAIIAVVGLMIETVVIIAFCWTKTAGVDEYTTSSVLTAHVVVIVVALLACALMLLVSGSRILVSLVRVQSDYGRITKLVAAMSLCTGAFAMRAVYLILLIAKKVESISLLHWFAVNNWGTTIGPFLVILFVMSSRETSSPPVPPNPAQLPRSLLETSPSTQGSSTQDSRTTSGIGRSAMLPPSAGMVTSSRVATKGRVRAPSSDDGAAPAAGARSADATSVMATRPLAGASRTHTGDLLGVVPGSVTDLDQDGEADDADLDVFGHQHDSMASWGGFAPPPSHQDSRPVHGPGRPQMGPAGVPIPRPSQATYHAVPAASRAQTTGTLPIVPGRRQQEAALAQARNVTSHSGLGPRSWNVNPIDELVVSSADQVHATDDDDDEDDVGVYGDTA